MEMTPRDLSRFLLLCFLVLGVAPAQAVCPPPPAKAGTHPIWIQLPRAAEVLAYEGWPVAPLPNQRALDRRARRGDAARAERLGRGPDPAALARVAGLVDRVRTVSRLRSAVSADVTPQQHTHIVSTFGLSAVRPVLGFDTPPRVEPDTWWPARQKYPSSPGMKTHLDYGPSLKQIQQIQVDALHEQGFTGKGVRILVIDTGFEDTHVALTGLNVIDEKDFVCDDDNTANEACDHPSQHNHGTGVLAVLGGFAPGDLIGPAYGAEYLLAKTEDIRTETQVEEDNYVAALEWGEALGADLTTASLGYTSFDDGFEYPPEAYDGDTAVITVALDDIAALGILPVNSAGNGGPNPSTLVTPADGDSVLSIGGVDSLGVVANFSSRGPTFDGRIKPDVVARGRLTTWAIASGGFGTNNGTSLAAPLAAGAAALVMEGHPEWDGMQVLNALRDTATQAGTPDNNLGWGIVQAEDALYSTDPIYPLPFPLYEPADGSTGVGTGAVFRWGTSVDFQSQPQVHYTVHASTQPDFSDTIGLWFAVDDTTRVIDPLPAGPFFWRVLADDGDGNVRASCAWVFTPGDPTGTTDPVSVPWAALSVPHPNPFNPRVNLVLRSDRPASAEAVVFDVAGRRVRSIWQGRLPVGDQTLSWDGTDAQGKAVASGVYLVRARLESQGAHTTDLMRRMVLVR